MRSRIILTCLLIPVFFLSGLSKNNNEYRITDDYKKFRDKAFTVPEEMRSDEIEKNDIYNIIFEFGYGKVIATLAAGNDGTVSLHYSNTDSPEEIVKRKKLKQICLRLISEAENCIRFSIKTLDKSFPGEGGVVIYFITVNREYKTGDTESNLKNNKSKFSGLYFIALELLAEIKNIEK